MKRLSRLLLLISVVCFMVMLTGCTADWTSQAISIIGQLVPAITGILSLLSAFGVAKISPEVLSKVTTAATQVQNDLQTIIAPLIQQYEQNPNATLLQQIQEAIAAVQENWDSVFSTLDISDPQTEAKVKAVGDEVAAEIASILAIIPVIQSAGGDVTKINLDSIEATGIRTAKQFQKDFDNVFAEASAGTPVYTKNLLRKVREDGA